MTAAARRRSPARSRCRATASPSSAPTGTIPAGAGRTEHDLRGHALAPGFIDAHTHDDRIVLDAPDMLPKISQGVTTVVAGNCGISLAPVTFDGYPPAPMNLLGGKDAYEFPRFADYAKAVADDGAGGQCRCAHRPLGASPRDDVRTSRSGANEDQVAAMLDLVDEAMESGAAGFSTGLFYPTNAAAQIDEVAPIATRFAEHGGVYATHMRDETDRVLDSIDEALATAGRAKIQLVISHHKCAHPRNWGRTRETLPKIEAASHRQPVAVDCYPYTAGSTNLRMDLVTHRLSDHDRVVRAASRDGRPRPRPTSRRNGASTSTKPRGASIPPVPSISR